MLEEDYRLLHGVQHLNHQQKMLANDLKSLARNYKTISPERFEKIKKFVYMYGSNEQEKEFQHIYDLKKQETDYSVPQNDNDTLTKFLYAISETPHERDKVELIKRMYLKFKDDPYIHEKRKNFKNKLDEVYKNI